MEEKKDTELLVPGARIVLFTGGYGSNEYVRKGQITKKHKNGNVKIDCKGYEPLQFRDSGRTGLATGPGYHKPHIEIWDEQNDAEIKERFRVQKNRTRLLNIEQCARACPPEKITEEALDQIETALSSITNG